MTDLETNTGFRWAIRHETSYRYDTAVAFAPHILRLTPRPDSARTLARHLQITPTPIEVSDFSDEFGNICTRVSFGANAVDELIIESRVEVQTVAARPQWLATLGLPPLPWTPPASDLLWAFRQPDTSQEVAALAQRLVAEVGGAPLAFFEHLSSTLYAMIDRQIRVEGSAQTPAQTLALGRGACRDLTVLYLAVCRSLGVAGRFVSGYQGQESSPDNRRHLHAWPEVFVPEY
ncbi:MAG TPA: transglutaminase family protein, partial [Polyangiaceae bacterium]|nr:transglutaminase family protein [Polyangiaceae bacterium]